MERLMEMENKEIICCTECKNSYKCNPEKCEIKHVSPISKWTGRATYNRAEMFEFDRRKFDKFEKKK